MTMYVESTEDIDALPQENSVAAIRLGDVEGRVGEQLVDCRLVALHVGTGTQAQPFENHQVVPLPLLVKLSQCQLPLQPYASKSVYTSWTFIGITVCFVHYILQCHARYRLQPSGRVAPDTWLHALQPAALGGAVLLHSTIRLGGRDKGSPRTWAIVERREAAHLVSHVLCLAEALQDLQRHLALP